MIDITKRDIAEYGLHVIKVLEDDEGPGFGYSIGLFHSYHHHEILIIGLRLDLIHILINNIGHNVKNGLIYEAGNFYEDILDGYKCYMTEVKKEHYNRYVGKALEYYGNNKFPLLQCIYPTVSNIYPWQSAWPNDLEDLQPILGEINIKQKETDT